MPAFTDALKREWLVTIDAPKIQAVRTECQLDLAGLDGTAFQKLHDDPCLLVNVLWVLCRQQRTDVTATQFGEALVGDPIEQATEALITAVTDFFPQRKRSLLRSLAQKQAAVITKGMELLTAKMGDPNLEARMLEAAETRLTKELEAMLQDLTGPSSVSNSPASAESAPTA